MPNEDSGWRNGTDQTPCAIPSAYDAPSHWQPSYYPDSLHGEAYEVPKMPYRSTYGGVSPLVAPSKDVPWGWESPPAENIPRWAPPQDCPASPTPPSTEFWKPTHQQSVPPSTELWTPTRQGSTPSSPTEVWTPTQQKSGYGLVKPAEPLATPKPAAPQSNEGLTAWPHSSAKPNKREREEFTHDLGWRFLSINLAGGLGGQLGGSPIPKAINWVSQKALNDWGGAEVLNTKADKAPLWAKTAQFLHDRIHNGDHLSNPVEIPGQKPITDGATLPQTKLDSAVLAREIQAVEQQLAKTWLELVNRSLSDREKNVVALYCKLTGQKLPIGLDGWVDEEELKQLKGMDKSYLEKLTAKLEPQAKSALWKLQQAPVTLTTAAEKQMMEHYGDLKAALQKVQLEESSAAKDGTLARESATSGSGKGAEVTAPKPAFRKFIDSGIWKNFAKGFVLGGAIQLTEDSIDRLVDKNHGNRPSWYFDSLTFPIAMLAPGKWYYKFGGALAGWGAGKWLDHEFPVNQFPSYSPLLKPTPLEGMLVAGAAMLPLKKETMVARAGLVGTAWLLSKIGNALSGPSGGEIEQQAINRFVEDKTQRTSESMQKAIDSFKVYGTQKTEKLGPRGETPLDARAGEWLRRPHSDKLNGYRGAAILLTALGERRLEDGTYTGSGPLDPGSTRSGANPFASAHYFLGGKNYDLGGRSLKILKAARQYVELAKSETRSVMSNHSEWRGSAIEDDEVKQLDEVGTRIDRDIEKIYGKHDLEDVYEECRKYAQTLETMQIRGKLQDAISNAGNLDNQLRSKLYRDLALIDLAIAGMMIDRDNYTDAKKIYFGTSNQGFDGARHSLRMAAHFDSSNPDNQELEKLAGDIEKQLSGH